MKNIVLFIAVCAILVPFTAISHANTRIMVADTSSEGTLDVPPLCEDGIIKDDGCAETGYGWVPSAIEGTYVQEFHGSDFPGRALESVCICWMRTRSDDEIDFDIVIYGDYQGEPLPTPRHIIPAHASAVPAALDGAFTEVDLGGLQLGSGTFYIGARWNPSIDQFFFVCADRSIETEITDGWFIDDRADEWSSVLTTTDPIFADHRAMLIRPVGGEGFGLALPTMGNVGIFVFIGVLAVFAMLILRRRVEPK